MSKRIRYEKTHQDGILMSVRTFFTSGHAYRIKLDLKGLAFAVIDLKTNEPAAMGLATSAHALKLEAKDALVALGCVFDEESRNTE